MSENGDFIRNEELRYWRSTLDDYQGESSKLIVCPKMIAESMEKELFLSLQTQLAEYSNNFSIKIINLKEAIEYQKNCTNALEREYNEKIDEQKSDIQEHNEDLVVQTKRKLLDEVSKASDDQKNRIEELERAVREAFWTYEKARSELDNLMDIKNDRILEFQKTHEKDTQEFEARLSTDVNNDVEGLHQAYKAKIHSLRNNLKDLRADNRDKFCFYQKSEAMKESNFRELKESYRSALLPEIQAQFEIRSKNFEDELSSLREIKSSLERRKLEMMNLLTNAHSQSSEHHSERPINVLEVQSEIQNQIKENQDLLNRIDELKTESNLKTNEFYRIIEQIENDFRSIEAKYKRDNFTINYIDEPLEIECNVTELITVTDQKIEDSEARSLAIESEKNKAVIVMLQNELSSIEYVSRTDDHQALIEIYEQNNALLEHLENEARPMVTATSEYMKDIPHIIYEEDIYVSSVPTEKTEIVEPNDQDSTNKKSSKIQNELEDQIEIVSINNMSYLSQL